MTTRNDFITDLVERYRRAHAQHRAASISNIRKALKETRARMTAAATCVEMLTAYPVTEPRTPNQEAGSLMNAVALEINQTVIGQADLLSGLLHQWAALAEATLRRVETEPKLKQYAALTVASAIWSNGPLLGITVSTTQGGAAESLLVEIARNADDRSLTPAAALKAIKQTRPKI
jgi:hypothetical protein